MSLACTMVHSDQTSGSMTAHYLNVHNMDIFEPYVQLITMYLKMVKQVCH